MSANGDKSPHSATKQFQEDINPVYLSSVSNMVVTPADSSLSCDSSSAPKISTHQDVVEAVWPLLMKEVEKKMLHMEQELIKRHNIKMMNEMQEVVRQIKQAKTKNDEMLRDTQKKQADVARSVLEIAEKLASIRAEVEELKRQAVINKQQLTHRCDQTTDQVAQLKHAVFTAWQKEKAEIQQKVSQSFRGDLSSVLSQFDAKLKESFSETSKLRYEVKRVTAKMNGEDPDAVTFEMPAYVDTTVPPPPPAVESSGTTSPCLDESSSSSAAAASALPSVNMQSLTQNLAMFIARQQQASGSSGPPQVNVAMLQQFMQTLPRQQQLQLQMLLQQHRAAQQSPQPSPSIPPGLGLTATPAPPPVVTATTSGSTSGSPSGTGSSPAAPAATMIQSLAQQLQLQVNAAQQKASTSGAGSVNCPFYSMFGWCKFGDRCKYVHQPTGKEPLRNLPQTVIQTLQTQLASGSTAETTQTLMTALAGLASKQQQSLNPPVPAVAPPPTASTTTNAVQQAMIQAQIQAQQDAAQLGSSKAKTLPCRFYAIGRCAYGDRCAYSHGKDTSSSVAAAAAAAWGKTDLSQASWGSSGAIPKDTSDSPSEEGIIDGEDDTNYDQWNAMTFEDSAAPPGVVSASEMKVLDEFVIHSVGIPSLVLMENAASAVVEVIRSIPDSSRILVVCGPGNNGADGLAVARKLAGFKKYSVSATLVKDEMKSEAGKLNLNLLLGTAFDVSLVDCATVEMHRFDIIVDALLGSGSRVSADQISPMIQDLIDRMNAAAAKIIAVDIPSGVCPNSGDVLSAGMRPVQAHTTITFGLVKSGLLFHPGKFFCGRLVHATISFPLSIERDRAHMWINPVPVISPRISTGHKGSFGKALFFSGSEQYFGAPLFASLSFLKAGGGYSRLSTRSPSVAAVVAARAPEVVMVGAEGYEPYLDQSDVVVLGPGLGLKGEAGVICFNVINKNLFKAPLVIDGDGLNFLCLLLVKDIFLSEARTVVLTPHKGEWKRFFRRPDVVSDYEMVCETIEALKPFKDLPGELIVVCKGPTTAIVSSKGPNTLLNLSGNPSLATSGSGDILAGIIAALMCNPPKNTTNTSFSNNFAAVAAAVFVHGLAGDLGPKGAPMTASDIMELVPEAIRMCGDEQQRVRLQETYLPRVI